MTQHLECDLPLRSVFAKTSANSRARLVKFALNSPRCDTPDVILGDTNQFGVADLPHVRHALAVSLLRSGDISAASAARVAQAPPSEMLGQLSAMGIPLYGGSPADAVQEMDDTAAWLAPAPPSRHADERGAKRSCGT